MAHTYNPRSWEAETSAVTPTGANSYSHQCDRKKALSSPWIQCETVVHAIAPPTFSLGQIFLETTAAIHKSLLGVNKSSQPDDEATYQNPVLHLHIMILHRSCISRSCLRKLHLLYDPLTGPGRLQHVSIQAQELLKILLKHGGSCAWGDLNKQCLRWWQIKDKIPPI